MFVPLLSNPPYTRSPWRTGAGPKQHVVVLRAVLALRNRQRALQENGVPWSTAIVAHAALGAFPPELLGRDERGFGFGLNLTKLESYLVDGSFSAAQFYADAEGHMDSPAMRLAIEELRFFCPKGAVRVLGSYPADPFRRRNSH